MKTVILFILLPLLVVSQNSIKDFHSSRKSFIPSEKVNFDVSNAELVILNSDTLIAVTRNRIDLNKFNNDAFQQNKFLSKYLKSVFYYSNQNSEVVYYLMQWNTPIVVYIDNSIPKEVARNFKSFFLKLNDIPNLNISFAKTIKSANYLIRTTDKNFSFSKELYRFNSKQEQQNFAFNNGNYIPITDANKNIYGCILEINPKDISDNTILESNLKQLFFLSLGRFFMDVNRKESNSFLNHKYSLYDEILEEDIMFLKFHYQNMYDQKVNGTSFRKLLKAANQITP